jgi:hypothetical protein
MSAYKKLNKQDAYITTYTAHKTWEVSGSQFEDLGIQIMRDVTGSYYSSIKQLYYPTKLSGSIVSHSFDYYEQTTLNNPDTRNLVEGSFLVSLPRDIIGTNMTPGVGLSFYVNQVQQSRYVSASYMEELYTDDPLIVQNVDTLGLDDDGEGGIYVSGSNPRQYVGDIIYPHGIINITDSSYSTVLQNMWGAGGSSRNTRENLVLNWQSSLPIFTHNYHCKIRESEFNTTYNPSSLTSSYQTTYDNEGTLFAVSSSYQTGIRKNNITGSEFQPYITTVGLYNDANQLIAVAKMGQPVPKPANTDMTIIVKIDI